MQYFHKNIRNNYNIFTKYIVLYYRFLSMIFPSFFFPLKIKGDKGFSICLFGPRIWTVTLSIIVFYTWKICQPQSYNYSLTINEDGPNFNGRARGSFSHSKILSHNCLIWENKTRLW